MRPIGRRAGPPLPPLPPPPPLPLPEVVNPGPPHAWCRRSSASATDSGLKMLLKLCSFGDDVKMWRCGEKKGEKKGMNKQENNDVDKFPEEPFDLWPCKVCCKAAFGRHAAIRAHIHCDCVLFGRKREKKRRVSHSLRFCQIDVISFFCFFFVLEIEGT